MVQKTVKQPISTRVWGKGKHPCRAALPEACSLSQPRTVSSESLSHLRPHPLFPPPTRVSPETGDAGLPNPSLPSCLESPTEDNTPGHLCLSAP